MSEFSAGIDVKSVLPGYQAVVRHGDGTATKVWAPTAELARERAYEVSES